MIPSSSRIFVNISITINNEINRIHIHIQLVSFVSHHSFIFKQRVANLNLMGFEIRALSTSKESELLMQANVTKATSRTKRQHTQ
jgi:hypothetical protein